MPERTLIKENNIENSFHGNGFAHLLTSSVAHAANANTDEVTPAQYEAGQAKALADAKPLDGSMTLGDSKGCVWEVTEVEGILKLTRYLKPDGAPVCGPKQKLN